MIAMLTIFRRGVRGDQLMEGLNSYEKPIKKRGVMEKEKGRFRISILSVLILFLMVGWVEQAQSQEKYPTRAIDIIVAYPPGGASDGGTRIAAAYLNKKWGVPVNVVNKPGGGTVLGCLAVYQAPPDGYTVLADGLARGALLRAAVKDLPFEIMDRTFIAMMYNGPQVFCVHPTSPIKNLKDLEAEAKRDPGNFSFTLMGGTSGADYAVRQFFKVIGLDHSRTKPIPVQGGAQAVAMTAGGHVKLGACTAAAAVPSIRGGMMRPLCIALNERHPDLPDVPTAIEMGYAINVDDWHGFSGPPKLPTFVVETWNEALEEMSRDPEIIAKLKNIGTLPYYRNARATREQVVKEMEQVQLLWGLK
jgi:tripartite-type tricarboxylate transporter receptor subunit TctC